MPRRTWTPTRIAIAAIVVAVVAWSGYQWAARPDYTDRQAPTPVKGNASATVVVEEFSDFQCPACRQSQPLVNSILAQYGASIRLEYHHYPLTQIHPYAQGAAEASECANDQGKFWEYHDVLFDNQTKLQRSQLTAYASEAGLDDLLFDACLDSGVKKKRVREDVSEGNRRGVQGTPTFYLNGQQVTNSALLPAMIADLVDVAVATSTATSTLK